MKITKSETATASRHSQSGRNIVIIATFNRLDKYRKTPDVLHINIGYKSTFKSSELFTFHGWESYGFNKTQGRLSLVTS